MLGKKNDKKVAEISTIIGKETIFEGNLTVNSSIRIDGQVNGKVICSGDVTIGKEGLVKNSITARNLIVAGKVFGDVKVENKVHIYDTGAIDGRVVMKSIVIDENGFFRGESLMKSTDKKSALVKEIAMQEKENADTQVAATTESTTAHKIKE